ncbi:MAG: universal stress protein, partial [Caldilineaceae bacterium]|nr:universal stress protein [Caldilineaceae bacterium]
MKYETSKQRAVNEVAASVAATDASAPAVDTLPERILVALDASPHSLAALRAAAKLAATVHAELHGLFIEDDRLL